MFFMAEEKKTLTRVTEILADPAQVVREDIADHDGDKPSGHPTCAAGPSRCRGKPRGSCSTNPRMNALACFRPAVSFLGLYRDPTIGRNTGACDWRIADLVDGSKPATLYPRGSAIGYQPHQAAHSPDPQPDRPPSDRNSELAEGRPRPHGPLLMMLDEFPALGRARLL